LAWKSPFRFSIIPVASEKHPIQIRLIIPFSDSLSVPEEIAGPQFRIDCPNGNLFYLIEFSLLFLRIFSINNGLQIAYGGVAVSSR
jgi:hypothetical protein